MSGPLLELRGVSAGYGKFGALFDVSLDVPAGARLVVLGPNGAGKTTLARVCSGLVRPVAGDVRFDGRSVVRLVPFQIARRGLVHIPEGRGVFASLTVAENLELAFRQGGGRARAAAALARAYETFPRLAQRRRQPADTLSGGEQRLLALARVLAVPPRLLLVDEPSHGLDPAMVEQVFAALRILAERGTTLVVVEQHAARALELADRVAVLSHGRVEQVGDPAEVAATVDRLLGG